MKLSLTEEINARNSRQRFFAAANTYNGFVSYFSEIFDRDAVKRIYILKGGPGVGKSTLMKRYAEKAEEKGHTVTYYHCSSDPSSLDGVFVAETGTVILDGTSPHIFEPTYPGSRDVYVDLGRAWDTKKLGGYADEIKCLCRQKSSCYKTAYRMLGAAKNIDCELETLSLSFINKEKLLASAGRFISKHIKKHTCRSTEKPSFVLTEAVSSGGKVRFFTLENMAENLIFIKKHNLAERLFMSALSEKLRSAGEKAVFAVSPENPSRVCGIFLPESKLCISIHSESYCKELEKQGKEYKVINPARFVDAEKYKDVRSSFRFYEKCLDEITKAACNELSKAGTFHAKLEKIYGNATDYGLVNKIGKALLD